MKKAIGIALLAILLIFANAKVDDFSSNVVGSSSTLDSPL